MWKWSKLSLALVIAVGLLFIGAGAKPEWPARIVWVDTAGGANFQEFHAVWTVPTANKELPFITDYVVGKGVEMVEKMKAWEPGEGDVHVILFKPDGFVLALKEGIPLETLVYFTGVPETPVAPRAGIPNAVKIPLADLQMVLGVPTEGKGLQFWRDQFGFIYNKKFIEDPPTSFKELFERRHEWCGHIGVIRMDAKSGGGRIFMYDFLRAFGVDWTKPFDEILGSPEWEEAIAKWKEFSKCFFKPLAAEPPYLFEQFLKEDIWITEYAIDYTLWSRDRGKLPATIAASYAEEGIYGGNTLLVVPTYIPEEYKPAAYEFVNWLLSDYVQSTMFKTMYQYPGTEVWDIADREYFWIWDHVPRMEDLVRKVLENFPGFAWIKEHGMGMIE